MSTTVASNIKLIKAVLKALKHKASALSFSMSAKPRKYAKDPLENIIGTAKSGIKDGSIKHDRYLYGSRSPVKIKGKLVSEIVLEDRR